MLRALHHRGFTLLEIMIVVVLIGILIVVAVPLLSKSKLAANEGTAIGTLKAIFANQATYYIAYSEYAILEDLARQRYVDAVVATGSKDGYRHQVWIDSPIRWHAETVPELYGYTGVRSFYVDESGAVLGKNVEVQENEFFDREVASKWPEI